MDSFIGNWRTELEDVENAKEMAEAMGNPEIALFYEAGFDTSCTKEGDSYIMTTSMGGVELYKQKLCPDGKIENLKLPEGLEAEIRFRIEGDKCILEGTFGGNEVNTTSWLEDGKYVQVSKLKGVTMTVRSKKV